MSSVEGRTGAVVLPVTARLFILDLQLLLIKTQRETMDVRVRKRKLEHNGRFSLS